MALDKLVDSTQLDGAMTATANAIREKTGDSNTIAWDLTNGFKSAVEAIPSGGGSDPNLIPANIKTGVDILGVVGTYGGGPSSGSINIDQNGYYDVTNYASASINVTSSGSAQKLANGVNFYDYDGTVLYSYSVSEFANLSAMPANPSHAGLTAQGWNWTLVKAQAYVAKYGRLEIWQMYITDDRAEPALCWACARTVRWTWIGATVQRMIR